MVSFCVVSEVQTKNGIPHAVLFQSVGKNGYLKWKVQKPPRRKTLDRFKLGGQANYQVEALLNAKLKKEERGKQKEERIKEIEEKKRREEKKTKEERRKQKKKRRKEKE